MTDKYILSIIEKAKSGINVEGTNLDLKQKWWDLQNNLDEFIKDICSMSNTATGESCIIIGVDKYGGIYNAPLPMDEASIQEKHKEKIDPVLTIEFKEILIGTDTISVVYIPYSKNRPHVIKKYKNSINWIPVRFGSSTQSASRLDLDQMYEERNTKTEPNITVEIFEESLKWGNFAGYGQAGGPCFAVKLLIDNLGDSSDYITNVALIETTGNLWKSTHFFFEGLNRLDKELAVGAHERKSDVNVYISDQMPSGLRNQRRIPDLDKDSMILKIFTRNGKEIKIPIKPCWIREE